MEGKIRKLSVCGLVLCVFALIGSVLALSFMAEQPVILYAMILTNIAGIGLSLKAMGLATQQRLSAPMGVLGLLLGCCTALLDVLAILPR